MARTWLPRPSLEMTKRYSVNILQRPSRLNTSSLPLAKVTRWHGGFWIDLPIVWHGSSGGPSLPSTTRSLW